MRFYYGGPAELLDCFVKNAMGFKKAYPFAPFLVIVTSGILADYLKSALFKNSSTGFMNIHFKTLDTLAIEWGLKNSTHPRSVRDNDFYVHLTARYLDPQLKPLAPLYYQTIRDLQDADAQIPYLREFASQRENKDEQKRLFILADLLENFRQCLDQLNTADLSKSYLEAIKTLNQNYSHLQAEYVAIYGFYDATQLQIDLINEIILLCRKNDLKLDMYIPVRFKKPGQIHENLRYAGEFVSHMQFAEGERVYLDRQAGAAGDVEEEAFATNPFSCNAPKHNIKIISACGIQDEVWAVAKVILSLIEQEKIKDPGSVLIVARDLSTYLPHIDRIFTENQIPYWAEYPLPAEQDTINAIRDLFELYHNECRFRNLCDLVTSNAFINTIPSADEILLKVGVKSDFDQYISKLKQFIARCEKGSDIALQLLGQVEELYRYATFPETWQEWGRYFVELTGRFIKKTPVCEHIINAIQKKFRTLSILDEISRPSSEDAFEIALKIINQEAGEEQKQRGGVAVLDVMSARNLVYDTVFVLGLNNNKFPRYITEDPLLPDYIRKEIAEQLGYKIRRTKSLKVPCKKDGYNEELLLIYNLLLQARHQIFLCYQATDETGRLLQRSTFLDLLETQFWRCENKPEVIEISRHPKAKFERTIIGRPVIFTNLELITARGRRLSYTIDVVENGRVLSYVGSELGNLILTKVFNQGNPFSATSLADLVKCPFSFAMKYVLKLAKYEEPEEAEDEASRIIGLFIDKVMIELLKRWNPGQGLVEEKLQQVIHLALDFFRRENPDIELAQEDILIVKDAIIRLFNSEQFKNLFKGYLTATAQYETQTKKISFGGIEIFVYGIYDMFLQPEDTRAGPLIIDTKWIKPHKLSMPANKLICESNLLQHIIYPVLQDKPAKFAYVNLQGAEEYDVDLLFAIGTSAKSRVIIYDDFEKSEIKPIEDALIKLAREGFLGETPEQRFEMGYCQYCAYNVNCLRLRREIVQVKE